MSGRTCPQCGARNTDEAPWCTQCYTPFVSEDATPPPTEPTAGGDAPVEPGGVVTGGTELEGAGLDGADAGAQARTGPAAAASEGAPPVTAGSARDVRQDEHGEVEWRCATCEGWSPLASPTCVTCGTVRTGFGEPRTAELPDEQRTVLLSALMPGLGHLLAGRAGTGIARAVFGVGWLLGGVLLLIAAVRAGSGPWGALALLAGAAVVWILSVLDARALARGEQREYLDGRTLLWLMVGVTAVLVVTLLLDASRVGT